MANFYGTTSLDIFVGPDQVNTYYFAAGELQITDIVIGSSALSADTFNFIGAQSLGALNFIGVSHVEFLYFDDTGDTVDIPDWLATTAEPHYDALGDITYTLFVRGGGGADTLDASAVISDLPLLLEGEEGNDTIISGGGDGTKLTGGDGEDGFVLAAGAEEVLAGDENDQIYANGFELDGDTIDGGDGDDDLETISAGTAAFSMTGIETTILAAGGDNDVTITSDAHDGGEDVAPRIVGGGFADTVTINPGSSGFVGSAYENYTILGQGGVDILTGGSGDDTLDGGSEVDFLSGGGGDDTLIGGSGNDSMSGGSGDDLYVVDSAGDFVIELLSTGVDTIQTALASYTMEAKTEILDYTGTAAVSFTGNSESNTIEGSAANADFIWGGDGGDTLNGLGGADTLRGQAGDDTLNGGNGNDVLQGGSENDTLSGGGNRDTLTGGSGDDMLSGDAGSDTINGGAGSDTASYAAETVGVIADLTLAVNQVTTYGGDTEQLASIENLIGGISVDFLYGDAFANVIDGGAGNDTLDGRGGADTLDGGAHDDVLRPGGGDDEVEGGLVDGDHDTVDYSTSSSDIVSEYVGIIPVLGYGSASGGDIGYDTLHRLEAIIGGGGGDTFSGWSEATGNAGDDSFEATNGIDSYFGGEGIDTVVYNFFEGASDLIVDLEDPSQNTNAATGDTLDGIENVTYTGTGTAYISGDGAGNRLEASGAYSYLDGRGGDDTLAPLGIGEIVVGDAGFDTADYGASAAGIVLASLGANILGSAGAVNDVLVSVEALKGSAFDDTMTVGGTGFTLSGEGGVDTLTSGAGVDRLSGGEGGDYMTGGAGADTFTFAPGGGIDTIYDFSHNADKVEIAAAYGFADAQAVVDATIQSGDYARIVLNATDSVYLTGYLALGGGNTIAGLIDDIIVL